MPDFEWADDDAAAPGGDEELAGQHERRPWRPRTRIAVGLCVAALLGGAVAVGIGSSGNESAPRPTPSTVPSRIAIDPLLPSERTFSIEGVTGPSKAITAIMKAFPGVEMTGIGETYGTTREQFYQAADERRRVLVIVRRVSQDKEFVGSTRHSVRIAQRLRDSWIDVRVTVPRGRVQRADYAGAVRLVRDVRLLP